MPPALAALGCLLVIAYLFRSHFVRSPATRVSWVPFVWMFIAGSRFVSHWLNLRPVVVEGDPYAEGSPVDRAIFLFLIACGCVVLYRRRINWQRLVIQNKWLMAYFAYCLLSILWTEEPYILTKRWVKDLGNPIMALILLTEPLAYDAIGTTVRRLSLVFVPVSVLFIKYFPEFGRGYTVTGAPMYTGIGEQKNALGLICLTTGIYYGWCHLHRRDGGEVAAEHYDLLLVGATAWLLYMSNSQTSLACLLVALAILAIANLPFVCRQPTRIVGLLICVAIAAVVADQAFDLKAHVIGLLGRNNTLTNRTTIWDVVTAQSTNPLVGTGFMSFWTGERMRRVWSAIGGELNQAHNGYVEQYLNLGYVGIAFIIAIAVSALVNLRAQLRTNYPVAILRLCLIVAALLYNYTEASFYGINNMWVLFLVSAIDVSGATTHKGADQVAPSTAPSPARIGRPPRRAERPTTVRVDSQPSERPRLRSARTTISWRTNQ